MRMKEVCEKTGLTDRAVRLYIENGLLEPERVSSYTGYTSIHFSEDDLHTLKTIASLRRTEFAIADIKSMMEEPETIPQILKRHREELGKEIAAKTQILHVLSGEDVSGADSVETLAGLLTEASAAGEIPKEDSGMSMREFREMLKKRLPVVFAVIVLAVGTWSLLSLCVRAVFADPVVKTGGGYELVYHGVNNWTDVLFSAFPPLLMLAAAGADIGYFFTGRR